MALVITLAVPAAIHAVLSKREVRASIGWVGLILVFPIAGALMYWVFGVNRIRRRARSSGDGFMGSPAEARSLIAEHRDAAALRPAMPPSQLAPLAFLVGRVVGRPLLGGNRIQPLIDGEEAYPRMLAAIESAENSVGLSTYIFDDDFAGMQFVDALGRAVQRGVEVRVLVDSVGLRYSKRPVTHRLRSLGIRAAPFMPGLLPFRWPFWNLRTHRKILTIDGRKAFIGGMNIREGHLVQRGQNPTHDIHFEVEGPVVWDIQEVFAGDWAFTTKEFLGGVEWFPKPRKFAPAGDSSSDELVDSDQGDTLARVIPDGPDEDLDKIRWVLLGALANARDTIRIQTPYFLPDTDLVTALQVAALRGVQVEILLPAESNLPIVQWASTAQLWQVLEHGCQVLLAGPPFDHSKLLLVDGRWALIGSANWDLRSLRLNFEIDMEVYDREVVGYLERHFVGRAAGATRVTTEALNQRPLWRQVRDGIARLGLPYL
ncbi:MAG: PLDc N-terminal domain-containing protein [Thermoanaerobaculia bacterium]|nr:PLDc N-terminal domain-containing protein [Thermoanaerobaculia bacterium]